MIMALRMGKRAVPLSRDQCAQLLHSARAVAKRVQPSLARSSSGQMPSKYCDLSEDNMLDSRTRARNKMQARNALHRGLMGNGQPNRIRVSPNRSSTEQR